MWGKKQNSSCAEVHSWPQRKSVKRVSEADSTADAGLLRAMLWLQDARVKGPQCDPVHPLSYRTQGSQLVLKKESSGYLVWLSWQLWLQS